MGRFSCTLVLEASPYSKQFSLKRFTVSHSPPGNSAASTFTAFAPATSSFCLQQTTRSAPQHGSNFQPITGQARTHSTRASQPHLQTRNRHDKRKARHLHPSIGPRRQLALVSKQIHSETINLIKAFKHKPCAHWNFSIRTTIPPWWTGTGLDYALRLFDGTDHITHDLVKPGACFHFFTAHACKEAPAALIVTLPDALSGPKSQLQLTVERVEAPDSEKEPLALSVRVPTWGPAPFDASTLEVPDFMARLAYAVFDHVLGGTSVVWGSWRPV